MTNKILAVLTTTNQIILSSHSKYTIVFHKTNINNLKKSKYISEVKLIVLSVIRQKGESQNVCFKKTKHVKFSEKPTFLTP